MEGISMDLWMRRREERQAVDEAGGGVSEGFELAETELIEHASHGDSLSTSVILRDARMEEPEKTDAVYGEADDARLRD
jgi:hypothetical protein